MWAESRGGLSPNRSSFPPSAKQTSVGMLLGHPRFSSTDMGLETRQEMEMHFDFLCPLLLLEPNSISSFGFRGKHETEGKWRCWCFFVSIPRPLLIFSHYLSSMQHLFPGNLTDLGNCTFGFHVLWALLKCSHRVISLFFKQNVSPS